MQAGLPFERPAQEPIAVDAWLLPGLATPVAEVLCGEIERIVAVAPWRTMTTPGGLPMSVTTTGCGTWGWCASRAGYGYSRVDPQSGRPWPAMPAAFAELAERAASLAGWPGFSPDACLLNRYAPGARMGLHQDRDERDLQAPIVSVSLGLPATFVFGGAARTDPTVKVPLEHGDVVVFGGRARLCCHGVLPVRAGHHPRLGPWRVNLTFRRAR